MVTGNSPGAFKVGLESVLLMKFFFLLDTIINCRCL